MTTDQHQCVRRASRLLIYALRWLEKAMAEEMSDDELKRLQRAQELIRKALEKL
jgi:hypothetical protein